MKVIIFGAGNYYQKRKEQLRSFSNIEIIAFADNNEDLWDKRIDHIIVISPDSLKTQLYDIILIMSIYSCQIFKQLLSLGVDECKIMEWERLCARQRQGNIKLFCSNRNRKVLIISQELNYDGGSLTAIYAARALKKQGTFVVLSVPGGNSGLINEVVCENIPVVTDSALPYIFEMEKKWIEQFDVVIVNLLTMVESACEISHSCPVLWWIHESVLVYEALIKKSIRLLNDKFENINIYAVSGIAQNNFNNYVVQAVEKILMLGIPDTADSLKPMVKKDKKMIFAIIGTVHKSKAQDIFLRAAMDAKEMNEAAEFWIIGKMFDDDYCKNIKEQAGKLESVKVLGEMTREELENLYCDIDVVVCSSHEETLSMTIVEAMMEGKMCITTDHTGIANYIQDGVNGFIVPVNNSKALTEKIEWIILNRHKANEMRQAARKTYEENFTMDIFGKNLETALNETILEWKKNRC